MKLKSIALAVLGTATISLIGCSSGSSNAVSSGVAFDWYVKDATVFADLNKNGIKDANEPSTKTDANGKYTLTVDSVYGDDYVVVVKGGTDIATNKPFTGVLKAGPKDPAASPATTLKEELKAAGVANPEAVVKEFLGLPADKNITEDPAKDPVVYKAVLKADAVVKTLAKTYAKAIAGADEGAKVQHATTVAIKALAKTLKEEPTPPSADDFTDPTKATTIVAKVNEKAVAELTTDPTVQTSLKTELDTAASTAVQAAVNAAVQQVANVPDTGEVSSSTASQVQSSVETTVDNQVASVTITTKVEVEIPVDVPVLTGATGGEG